MLRAPTSRFASTSKGEPAKFLDRDATFAIPRIRGIRDEDLLAENLEYEIEGDGDTRKPVIAAINQRQTALRNGGAEGENG